MHIRLHSSATCPIDLFGNHSSDSAVLQPYMGSATYQASLKSCPWAELTTVIISGCRFVIGKITDRLVTPCAEQLTVKPCCLLKHDDVIHWVHHRSGQLSRSTSECSHVFVIIAMLSNVNAYATPYLQFIHCMYTVSRTQDIAQRYLP